MTYVIKGAKIAIIRLKRLRRCDFTTKKTYKWRCNKWLTFLPVKPEDKAEAEAKAKPIAPFFLWEGKPY